MKLRNKLLALFCLLLFAAFGYFYVREWVVQKPFGIILFVSDGMVSQHLSAARLYEGGAEHRLALESFAHLASVSNSARDFSVPDEASAATALATGVKVNQRHIALSHEGKVLQTILERAKAQGRSVGIVTTGQLTGPTAAAFYAHIADSRDTDQIAVQFAQKALVDVALGGGSGEFLPEDRGGRRKDKRNLQDEMQKSGREFVWTKADLENAGAFRTGSIVGMFSPGPMAYSDEIESGGKQPSLSDMVRRAIEFLQVNRKGYLLVVDASLVTQAAEANEGERTLTETLSLDRAIATATKYAGDKALLLAVGKRSVGGLNLNGNPPRQDHGVALIGTTATGHPSLTWATGPNGPTAKTEPSAFSVPTALPVAQDVIAVGQGEGAEKLHGFIQSTAIFELLNGAL
jgi:alkaline phosphatase